MLHCIVQVNGHGGENQFVDGLNVAEQIRTEFPDAYKLLTTQNVNFRDVGDDCRAYHVKTDRPIIEYVNIATCTLNLEMLRTQCEGEGTLALAM